MTGPNPMQGAPALDPSLDPAALHALAQTREDLWVQIVQHPNAYPGLLAWFKTQNRPDVQAALAAREAGIQPVPVRHQAPVQPAPVRREAPPQRPQPQPQPTPAAESSFARPSGADKPSSSGSPFTPRAQRVAQPAAPQRPAMTRTPGQMGPVNQEVDDRTVLASRRQRELGTLSFGAEPVVLMKERVVIGRKLNDQTESDDLQLVKVTDPSKTVSGTHAELLYRGGTWYVKDLDSTNGIYRVGPGGEETEVVGEEPLDGNFYLGDVLFTLTGK